MTSDLEEIARRVEAATGPDAELDAIIRCAVFAPKGAIVEQSPINGAWCIYSGISFRDPSRKLLWEALGLSQLQRWGEFTASLEAAMTLVPEGWDWAVYTGADGRCEAGCALEDTEDGCRTADSDQALAATPSLALTAAALRARNTHLGGNDAR